MFGTRATDSNMAQQQYVAPCCQHKEKPLLLMHQWQFQINPEKSQGLWQAKQEVNFSTVRSFLEPVAYLLLQKITSEAQAACIRQPVLFEFTVLSSITPLHAMEQSYPTLNKALRYQNR